MLQDQLMKNSALVAKGKSKADLHDLLQRWCLRTNEDSKRFAHYALDSFYKVLCKALVVRKGQADDGKEVFKVGDLACNCCVQIRSFIQKIRCFSFQYYLKILRDKSREAKIESKLLGTCIKGFGYFGSPCSVYHPVNQLNDYFRGFVDFAVRNLLE